MVLRLDSPSSSWLRLATVGLLPLAVSYELAGLSDILLVFLLAVFSNWKLTLQALQSYELCLIFGVTSGIALASWLVKFSSSLRERKSQARKTNPESESPRPLFFPSRTTHTRLFPKSHSFSYPYLLVGIPVGWRGSIGRMLAADQVTSRPKLGAEEGWSSGGWYTVNAADYLGRGYGHLGLDGKLKQFLINEGEKHEKYPYAYLITAPRFMGYSFNPVSFWYLYNEDRELAGMVLEVNNTFDERHLYLLKPSQDIVESSDVLEEPVVGREDSVMENGRSALARELGDSSKKARFSNSWPKAFHVSPFNSRKGSYSLTSYDPLYPSMTGLGPVNNTITLLSSKHHPKLVARITSEGAAIDPGAMSKWQKILFLSLWWWVGYLTFPRIVVEAGRLFFKRKLHVWFRPEPLKSSIGRNADATEQVLERCFRNYLQYLVQTATPHLVVKYTPSGIKDTTEVIIASLLNKRGSPTTQTLRLKILTPIFYSRFVRYAHDLEAIFSEFSESSTIWVSNPSLLPDLLLKKPIPSQIISGWVDYVSFKLIQNLRQRPSKIERTTTFVEKAKTTSDLFKKDLDIRTFRLSAMDGYFLTCGTRAERMEYRGQVLKLLVSDRIAFGSTEILAASMFLLKCGFFWVFVRNFWTLNI